MKDGAFYLDIHKARRQLVLQYLSKADYHAARAAEIAGVYEKTFRRWMKEHGIRLKAVRTLAP